MNDDPQGWPNEASTVTHEHYTITLSNATLWLHQAARGEIPHGGIMPNISMCQAAKCLFSETCRRHEDSGTVPNPKRQSYAMFQPQPDGRGCDAYWHTQQRSLLEEDDAGDIAPGDSGDGRIVRKPLDGDE